jgi:hypothetical protein
VEPSRCERDHFIDRALVGSVELVDNEVSELRRVENDRKRRYMKQHGVKLSLWKRVMKWIRRRV